MKIYNNLYYILFVPIAVTSILLIVLFDNPIFNYVVPIYFVIVYGILLMRYIIVLIKVSKKMMDLFPSFYQKYKGFSKIKGMHLVSPTVVFDNRLNQDMQNKNDFSLTELKTILILMVLAFIFGIILGLLIVV